MASMRSNYMMTIWTGVIDKYDTLLCILHKICNMRVFTAVQ